MHLVEDLALERHTGPRRVTPVVAGWIDNLGGAVGTVGLKPRGRILDQAIVTRDAETVPGTGACLRREGRMVPARLALHGQLRRASTAAVLQHEVEACVIRRPHAEVHAASGHHLGADWKPAAACAPWLVSHPSPFCRVGPLVCRNDARPRLVRRPRRARRIRSPVSPVAPRRAPCLQPSWTL